METKLLTTPSMMDEYVSLLMSIGGGYVRGEEKYGVESQDSFIVQLLLSCHLFSVSMDT